MWSKGKRISWIDEEKVNEKKDQKSTFNPNHIPLNTSNPMINFDSMKDSPKESDNESIKNKENMFPRLDE